MFSVQVVAREVVHHSSFIRSHHLAYSSNTVLSPAIKWHCFKVVVGESQYALRCAGSSPAMLNLILKATRPACKTVHCHTLPPFTRALSSNSHSRNFQRSNPVLSKQPEALAVPVYFHYMSHWVDSIQLNQSENPTNTKHYEYYAGHER